MWEKPRNERSYFLESWWDLAMQRSAKREQIFLRTDWWLSWLWEPARPLDLAENCTPAAGIQKQCCNGIMPRSVLCLLFVHNTICAVLEWRMYSAFNSYSFKLLKSVALDESVLNHAVRGVSSGPCIYFVRYVCFQGGQRSGSAAKQHPKKPRIENNEMPSWKHHRVPSGLLASISQPTCYRRLHFQHALLLAEDVGPIIDDL